MSGKQAMAPRRDRRVARTRAALIEAFNHLTLRGRQRKIRVSDIVERANVGRSTFYEHFAGADAIHMESLSRPLAVLADAAAGSGDAVKLEKLLAHFWENRRRARETFAGRSGETVSRLLADMVEERLIAGRADLGIPVRLAALQLASAALAPIRGWIMAEASCAPNQLAQSICRCAERMLDGLAADASLTRKGENP